MVNIGIETAFISALLGYAVVFLGIVFLMAVITLFGRTVDNSGSKRSSEKSDEKDPMHVTNSNISTADNISVKNPDGIDPKKVAAAIAAISEFERRA